MRNGKEAGKEGRESAWAIMKIITIHYNERS